MKLNGWAVESRVYAEDPYRNFLPSTGRLTRYRPPAERSADGVTVRNDTGVYEGGEISIYYDPMIAKLVTHAPTRASGDRGAGRCARCLRHRRHPPQHSVPRRADGASALARRQALDRLHRRGISRRLPSAAAGGRGGAQSSPPSRRRSTTCWASASASISGQVSGNGVTRESRRAVWLGEREHHAARSREADGVIAVRFARQGNGRRMPLDVGLEARRSGLERHGRRPVAGGAGPRRCRTASLLAHRGVETRPTSTPSARPPTRG